MIYITKENLITHSYERFIEESTKDNPIVIDQAEAENIEIVKSYLSNRYDVTKTFNPDNPIHSPLLVRIITKLTLYDVFRRNAPRKINQSTIDDYEEAMKQLNQISTGRIVLNELPKPTDENGSTKSNSIYGNNSNKNFYI